MTKKANLTAIVLAAGQSKRFKTATPKVLHPVCGRPLIEHVLDALRPLKPSGVVVVVPPGRLVERALAGSTLPLAFVVQKTARGTGDAAKLGLAKATGADEVLVIAGDGPLVTTASLRSMIALRRKASAAAAILTATLDDPAAYGRVVRDAGRVAEIVEARDCTAVQKQIREINTSTYVFVRDALAKTLPELRTKNAQAEYYLTDAIRLLVDRGEPVVAYEGDPTEALGTNTRRDYAAVTHAMRARILDALMDAGVTVLDPDTTFVDAGVTVGADTVLHPLTFLEGATRIGKACVIGPSAQLTDTTVGDAAHVRFTVARGTKIGPECQVGPFASLREGTVLRRKAKAGTFVEMKKAVLDEGAKVPHLSYMGDVDIGKRANIGAGTITCNYDGKRKHRTVIGDDAFVGTNNSLRAPVRIGRGAYTGAGSLVNRDVKPGETVYGVPARPAKKAKKKNTEKGA